MNIAKTKNKKIVEKKGFTLIEVLVALFLFAIVMVALSGIFVNFLKSYQKARQIQQTTEDAQYAMNMMAKILRTGSIVDNSSSHVKAWDYSQQKCVDFQYISNSHELRVGYAATGTTQDDCASAAISSITFSVTNVKANFDAQQTTSSTTPKHIGRVSVYVQALDPVSLVTKADVQTTVSLRNYQDAR